MSVFFRSPSSLVACWCPRVLAVRSAKSYDTDKEVIKVKSHTASLYDLSLVARPRADRNQRKHHVYDYGYHFNYHQWDERLPRIKDCQVPVTNRNRLPKNETEPVDNWSEEKAMFGRNDYIDLLGDGSIHPAQLLYHVPRWLRGFPGQHKANELVKLIHFRNLYKRKLSRNAPKQWHEVVKRIRYLTKYHNWDKQDEMHEERDLGLWNEEPDWFYKDKERRTHLDQP